MTPPTTCKRCGGSRLVLDGTFPTRGGHTFRRFRCQDCGWYRTRHVLTPRASRLLQDQAPLSGSSSPQSEPDCVLRGFRQVIRRLLSDPESVSRDEARAVLDAIQRDFAAFVRRRAFPSYEPRRRAWVLATPETCGALQTTPVVLDGGQR